MKNYDKGKLKLLEKILDFANERNGKRLPNILLDVALKSSLKTNIQFSPNRDISHLLKFYGYDSDILHEQALGVQLATRLALDCISEKKAVSFQLRGSLVSQGGQGFRMAVKDDGDEFVVVNIMSQILAQLAIKGIKKCPGCERFFVVRKTLKQVFCGGTCRQRIYQAGLSEKQKRASKLRRSELYRRKKENRSE